MQDKIQGVNYAWDVAAKAEENVDDKMDTAAAADYHGDGWKDNREDDNQDVGCAHL